MAIKEVLELVGSEVVIKQLNDVKKAGEESLATFNKPLPELKFPEIPKIDSKPIQDLTGHTVKLSEAFHVLRPIMQAIGVQFSEFGAFARLAGASLAGLGIAVLGAAVVGIAKLEENLATLKGRLTDVAGSTGGGQAAFDRLNASAKALGTTTEALFPSFQALKRGLDTFAQSTQGFKFVALRPEDLPQPRSIEAIASATENFFKILRAGRLDSAAATKASDEFFNSLKQAGKLTSEALDKLPEGTVQLLAQALGRGAISVAQFTAEVAKAPIPIDKVAAALAKFGPQADAAFKTNAIVGMSDALNGLLNTFNDIAQKLTGLKLGDAIASQIKALGEGIKLTVDQISNLITKLKEAAAFKIAGVPLFTISFDEKKSQDDAEKAGGTAAERFAKGWRDAPGAAKVEATDLVNIEPGGLADKATIAAKAALDAINKELEGKSLDTSGWVKSINEFINTFREQWNSQAPLKAPEIAPPIGTPGGGAPLLTATPGLSLLQSLFGGGGAQQPTADPATLVSPFQTASDQIMQIWTTLMTFIQSSVTSIDLSGATQALVAPFEAAVPQIQSVIQQVLQSVQELNQAIQQALQGAGQLGGFAAGGQGGFAGGGMVRGGGTTTSDSILAWLSNREFVVNAKAVSHYGPDFFAALNAMRLPQNFNMGGMARMMAGNKFAAGGMVKGNPVVLNIDRKSFNMSAGDDTITQLKRFAVASQLSSTGRKPRWVK